MTKKRIDRVSVFAECDAVVKDLPNERITSRLIGTRMGVSNTAVYKLVKQWREEAKKAQEELISQTQMSSKFVGALLTEVDARVTEMRQLDEQESTQMSQEMDEMAEQVGTLEAEIISLREQLDGRTIELATANEKLETQNKDLNDKLEAKGVELQGMTKDYAKAQVKAEAYDDLSKELADLKAKAEDLVGQNATLQAKQEATAMTISNLEASNADNIAQRNNAQEALALVNARLTDAQNALQTKTLECATLEATIGNKADSTEAK
ncbi:hypothetical protein [Vibrio agarivorans]|uniref:hypothetical protein n=1 Tax=Vibrio agarivorans TaxID=153622 RepID=UPI00222EF657|nr:hypothetical protein [Vibrio agarivorans]